MNHPQDVLDFWFGELTDGFADDAHRRTWFEASAAFDAEIGVRFGATLAAAAAGELTAWLAEPRGRLAFIVLADQMSRNVHRGTAEAFAADPRALAAARDGVDAGVDRLLALEERAFFYLPFEHSESAVDQHTAVGLFTLLRDETPQGWRQLTGSYLRYATQHRDVILRFGRFPHRNDVLGRASTEAERAFLESADRYGQ